MPFPFGGWATAVFNASHVIIEEFWVRFAKWQCAIPTCGLSPLLIQAHTRAATVFFNELQPNAASM